PGALESRVFNIAIRFSFQTLRSSCQTPSPIRIAMPANANIVASSAVPRRLRRIFYTHRLGVRGGPRPPYGDTATQSTGPSSGEAARALQSGSKGATAQRA